MNTVEHTEYKSAGQLPIIILLLILFAFKYFSGVDDVEDADKVEHINEVNGIANSGTQDLLIQTLNPID